MGKRLNPMTRTAKDSHAKGAHLSTRSRGGGVHACRLDVSPVGFAQVAQPYVRDRLMRATE